MRVKYDARAESGLVEEEKTSTSYSSPCTRMQVASFMVRAQVKHVAKSRCNIKNGGEFDVTVGRPKAMHTIEL